MSVHIKIREVVAKYLSENNYSEYKISALKGTILKGYCGCSQRIHVEAIKDSERFTKNLFVKIHTDSAARNERLNIKEKFTSESRFYNEILPLFENIQAKLSEELKFPYAKCLFASEDCIILEDLYEKGYESFMDGHKNLDESHARLMLKELAKYHALFFVLKQKFPNEFQKFSDYYKFSPFMDKRFWEIINYVWARSVFLIEDENIKKNFNEKGKYLMEKLMKKDMNKKSHGVICHGDFNYRNGMFIFNEDRQPSDAIMIDFQFMQYCSPVNDVYYLLFSSTSADVLAEKYDSLIETYYESLENFLKLLGYECEKLYPRAGFDEDMSEEFCNGLFYSIVSLRCFCRPLLENFDEFYDDSSQTNSIFEYADDDEIEYKIKINKLVKTLLKLRLM